MSMSTIYVKVKGQVAPLADSWSIYRTGHELILSKFVRLIFEIRSNVLVVM